MAYMKRDVFIKAITHLDENHDFFCSRSMLHFKVWMVRQIRKRALIDQEINNVGLDCFSFPLGYWHGNVHSILRYILYFSSGERWVRV